MTRGFVTDERGMLVRNYRTEGLMKRTVGVVVCVLGLAACGHSKITSNTVATQDTAQAQKIVQTCVNQSSNLFSRSGRKRVLSCLAPPGHEAQFQACATKVITAVGVSAHTPAGQRRLNDGLAHCVETQR